MLDQAWAWLQGAWDGLSAWATQATLADILMNRFARAAGMLVLVWVTIYVIAFVYSGYLQNSDIGPVGLRPHIGKRLGEREIVFDRSVVPYQMDGVEAKCQFYYVYDDGDGKRQRVPLNDLDDVQLHIRPTALGVLQNNTHFGFEVGDPRFANCESRDVMFPPFDIDPTPPNEIGRTPADVRSYVEENELIGKWTEDDNAPVISVGSTRLELVTGARIDHILDRAARLKKARDGNFLNRLGIKKSVKERSNVFGSFHLKLTFPNNPWFVLFRHPNRDLKMTAWLTILTSVFALAMDLWPIQEPRIAEGVTPSAQSDARPIPTRGNVPARRQP